VPCKNIFTTFKCLVVVAQRGTRLFASLFSFEAWASAGGETGICPPLEIGTKNQNY